jgi:hypothetical protein
MLTAISNLEDRKPSSTSFFGISSPRRLTASTCGTAGALDGNPSGKDGVQWRCLGCGSPKHLLPQCTDPAKVQNRDRRFAQMKLARKNDALLNMLTNYFAQSPSHPADDMLVGLDFELATFISPQGATPQTTHVANYEAVKEAIFEMDIFRLATQFGEKHEHHAVNRLNVMADAHALFCMSKAPHLPKFPKGLALDETKRYNSFCWSGIMVGSTSSGVSLDKHRHTGMPLVLCETRTRVPNLTSITLCL